MGTSCSARPQGNWRIGSKVHEAATLWKIWLHLQRPSGSFHVQPSLTRFFFVHGICNCLRARPPCTSQMHRQVTRISSKPHASQGRYDKRLGIVPPPHVLPKLFYRPLLVQGVSEPRPRHGIGGLIKRYLIRRMTVGGNCKEDDLSHMGKVPHGQTCGLKLGNTVGGRNPFRTT